MSADCCCPSIVRTTSTREASRKRTAFLGLPGMATAWRELAAAEQSSANGLSRDEWLGLMLDREIAMRADKRVRNKLASAMRYMKSQPREMFAGLGQDDQGQRIIACRLVDPPSQGANPVRAE
ncbi:MAG: hypothetical protein E5W91_27185 [Mesorhizobium sp.]|uniref:ATP-binding protein n=1 Tax=Mesorhizobium sp. TaxID=1871066 RepID=UPI001219D506|nr:ATP-binding protein [Mesorhizobium sp.]TIS54351.1 MAG: hypothetical protein E5W91_27185 [Mesorhizobium sp.]